jgi:hypothetical protein
MSANSSSAASIMSAPAKSAKRVTKKTDEAPVAAAAPVAVASTEAKPAKAPKAKAVKAEAPAAAAPAVVAPVVAAAASTDAAPVVEEVRLEAEVKANTARLIAMKETISELITESKKLEKKAAKLQKVADKRQRRRRAKVEGEEGKPAPVSIFQIPVALSPELCKFMGRPTGSKESRSNVTKFITNYVREKGLKNKHDINPDTSLRSLLNLKESDQLTYFNLQKHLNVHYPKSAAKVAATA